MQKRYGTRQIRNALLWIGLFTLIRFIYSGFFNLVPDEANYWQWSRYLAWGYHDQAPMIAWLIRASTLLFGHTEVAVRLPSVLAMTTASIYLVLIAKRWINPTAAWHTALLTQSVLLFNVGSLLATPDSIQAAAWAGATYHTARAYEEATWKQWLLGAVWFGFGMLSKYTMVIFLPSAWLYGMLSHRHRIRLMEIRPYVAALLGGLLFAPVIYWNFINNWNSIRHVAYIGGINEKITINLKLFFEFWGSQAGLLTPLVLVLVIWSWFRVFPRTGRNKKWIYFYLFMTSFPMIIGFAVLSLHTRIYPNWPGAGYLTASVLVAAFFGRKDNSGFRTKKTGIGQKIWPWAVGSSYFITLLVLTQAVFPLLPIPAKIDPLSAEISGWDILGQNTGAMMKEMPRPGKTFLFGLHYQEASELAFYTPGNPKTVSINRWGRPNVYDYWWEDRDLIGWDGIGVTYDPVSHTSRLNQVFRRVDPPVELKIFSRAENKNGSQSKTPIKIFYIYRGYGFKGGLKWVPEGKSDIRVKD